MNCSRVIRVAGFFLLGIMISGAAQDANATNAGRKADKPLVIAIEFNTHATAAYVAKARGLYQAEGLSIKTFDSYVTGMALAAAMTRGDVDVAYICLVPAISAYANGGVRLKVASGTHHHGYSVVVDPNKIKTPRDLEKSGIRIGCVREGNAADVVFQKGISHYRLDRSRVLEKVRRMNPPEQILALQMGQLDAAVMPEHYPSIAVAQGFKVLFSSRDVWPDMHGSTLVVSEKLLESSPEIVRSLVKVNREATRWIHAHPKEAAVIVANVLQADGGMGKLSPVFPAKEASLAGKLTISPDVTLASITRGLDITTKIDPQQVQKTIDFMYSQGLLRNRFEAQKILKLDWPEP